MFILCAAGSTSILNWDRGLHAGAAVFFHESGLFLTRGGLPLVGVGTCSRTS